MPPNSTRLRLAILILYVLAGSALIGSIFGEAVVPLYGRATAAEFHIGRDIGVVVACLAGCVWLVVLLHSLKKDGGLRILSIGAALGMGVCMFTTIVHGLLLRHLAWPIDIEAILETAIAFGTPLGLFVGLICGLGVWAADPWRTEVDEKPKLFARPWLPLIVMAAGVMVGAFFGLLAGTPDGFFTFRMQSKAPYVDPARDTAGVLFGSGSGIVAGAMWLLAMCLFLHAGSLAKTLVAGGAMGCLAGALAGGLLQLALSLVTQTPIGEPIEGGIAFGLIGGLPTGAFCGIITWAWFRLG